MTATPFDLTGKVAVITGGNGGIGLGMAEALAAAGASVCIWGTNEAKNTAALERLRAHGVPVAARLCDVSDEAAVDDVFSSVVAEFGRVDACFANAGLSAVPTPFVHMSTEDWRRVLAVNLDGAFFTLRAAARHMVARAKAGDPGGRLVGTASIAAVSGAARNEHYGATKGALVSLINALAVEHARYGITANSILPGWTESAMTQPLFDSEVFAGGVKPRIPAGRWGTPADFGGIAVYLASDASAYHTGDCLRIDGGYLLF